MRNADINIVDIANGKVQWMARPVIGADAKSFERLGGGWARDSRHVYFAGKRCMAIHPPSFTRLNQSYGIDENGVFCGNAFLADADPKTFQPLDAGLRLYSISIFSGSQITGYAKDAKHVWLGNLKVRHADASSFCSLGNGYGRDKSNIYYREKRIVGVDITSWRHWQEDMSLDEANVFFRWKKIVGVDRRSVTHLSHINCIIDRHGIFICDKRVSVERYLPITESSWEREALKENKLFNRILDEWPNYK